MYKTKGRAAFFGILFGLLLAAGYIALGNINCGGSQSDERISETRLLLGTTCSIIVSNEDVQRIGREAVYELLDEAFTLCADLEALLSITIEDSDVRHINNASGEPVTVSIQTIEVITEGIRYGELSDGMFDITIGRLTDLWGLSFTADASGEIEFMLPSGDEIELCRQTVDYKQVVIDGNTVQLENPEAWIDLGGIAKGYIADKTAAFLSVRGVENALVDFGGDIVVLGSREEDSSWRLGVAKPFGRTDDFVGVLELSDVAVVSSGIYERQTETDGDIYHHIIDPKTGKPAKSDVVGATIIAEDAVTGEGLSTIAVLTGSERIRGICEITPGFIGAVIITNSGDVITFGEAEIID